MPVNRTGADRCHPCNHQRRRSGNQQRRSKNTSTSSIQNASFALSRRIFRKRQFLNLKSAETGRQRPAPAVTSPNKITARHNGSDRPTQPREKPSGAAHNSHTRHKPPVRFDSMTNLHGTVRPVQLPTARSPVFLIAISGVSTRISPSRVPVRIRSLKAS